MLRLLRAAGFDLRLHLAACDPHDDILAELEAGRSESERPRRDRQRSAMMASAPAHGPTSRRILSSSGPGRRCRATCGAGLSGDLNPVTASGAR